MAEGAGEASQRGSGLWMLVTGVLLLLMELVLLAALVPLRWAERVQDTERAWLAAGLGPAAATAVVARADAWHDGLFVATRAGGGELPDDSFRARPTWRAPEGSHPSPPCRSGRGWRGACRSSGRRSISSCSAWR